MDFSSQKKLQLRSLRCINLFNILGSSDVSEISENNGSTQRQRLYVNQSENADQDIYTIIFISR